MIRCAARFAFQSHYGQLRKFTGRPYFEHVAKVAGRVAAHYGSTDEMVCAAYLHDVVEDCGVTLHQIELRFGPTISEMICGLTSPSKGSLLSREARKKIDRDYLANQPKNVQIIKLIDRIDNVRDWPETDSFFKQYCSESYFLANALREADEGLYLELLSILKLN